MAQTEIGELQVLITAQADKFNSEIANVQSQIKTLGSSVGKSTKSISTKTVAMGNIIAKAFTSAVSAISAQVDEAVTRLDTLNNFSKVMGNLGISSENSQAAINKLSDKLQGLPTSLSDAALAVQRFVSVNDSVQASTDMYLALNNAILAGGASTEMQASALEQMTQAYSKGKPEMQDWKTIVQAMPAQLKQVGLAMGYASTNELYDALQSGAITMDDFMKTVMQLNDKGVDGFASFADQARTATGGVQTSIKNMKIAIQRALANIMDAIGQSNIAGFFNKISTAIGTVSNYIAAFVKIIKEAVAWISALFGGSGSTKEIVKETASASSNMAGVASGAEDTTTGINNANKAAKKLKGTLASFDEMNILSENTSSGSDSGSAGGAGGGAWADYSWDNSQLSSASDKVTEAMEKIKNAFKNLFGDIDFTPLGNSIIKLWNGIKKAIDGALKIGKQFLDKFIVPLTKTAAENTVPRMFTVIGEALNGINFDVISEAFGNVFSAASGISTIILDMIATLTEWLAPIIKWLANFVVPPALEIIATILNTIGAILGGIWDGIKTMYENWIKPALEHLGKALEPILNVINDLFKGINNNSEAWEGFRNIISGAVRGALEWLFEFLGVIIETIATLIDWIISAGKWVVETCGKIGEWVGNLATDIGNWFRGAWDTIVGIFQGIGNWFSDRWNDVSNAFSSVGSWFGEKFNNAKEGIHNAFSGIGSWFGDRWNDIKNAFSNVWSVFSDIGKNMWEGIKNGLGNIGQKIGDIFGGAIDWVKNLFGIHSPSKVFAKIGSYVSEGFANGIEEETESVHEALEGLTEGFNPLGDITANIKTGVSAQASDMIKQLSDQETRPLQLLLSIDGEDIPISAKRIADTINDASFLSNRSWINV